MKKTTLLLLFLLPSVALAQQLNNNLTLGHNYTPKKPSTLKKLASKFSFNYGMVYLGPSLSPDYEDGATYNRFNSDQAWHGGDNDPTSSTQVFHAVGLGFQLTKNVKISYAYSFQDDLNSNVQYELYNADGSRWGTGQRAGGLSYNNQRINATVTNIYSNNYFFLMSGFFYELPTTEASINSDMTYGLGVQPIIGIYSYVPGLYHGLRFSFQRNYYRRQEFNYNCGGYTCNTKYQTLLADVSAYIGYNVSDKLTVQANLIYDWDMDGDQVDGLNSVNLANLGGIFDNEYNNNLDNVFEIGPTYRYSKNISFGTKVQFSVNKPDIKRSAIIGNFGLRI